MPDAVARTSAFSDRARPEEPIGESDQSDGSGLKRDDRLALVEDLERGPYEFTPPSDDPTFHQLEPHSGIRLSSVTFPLHFGFGAQHMSGVGASRMMTFKNI